MQESNKMKSLVEAFRNDYTQTKWVDGSVYFNNHVSKFPDIFPDRCSDCKIIFIWGGSNSILKSDMGYNCLDCDTQKDWWYFFDMIEEIREDYAKDSDERILEHLLDYFDESFEGFTYGLFIDSEKWKEEMDLFYLEDLN